MVSLQEPEIQFAQKLAANEKPTRTKAIKKLRKYIIVRSQNATGGFTGDELLKLWKGLFYCLWMQDKPLLQEDLSRQISNLIHSFHNVNGQFLYLESFLQTFKREWTGIDRLRMDKFYQLVRFMFRQTFELMKKNNWESSMVNRFLELLSAQVLHSSSGAPSGLQFHILDLYMTELATVGSAELTADQNLAFIEPFCKTAAKTKDRMLFSAICSGIFSIIIDQAPFAIDDLMKDLRAAEDSDSGQASDDDDYGDDQIKEKSSNLPGKKRTGKQINGNKSNEDKDEDDCDDDDDDDDDEGLLHLDDSDSELPNVDDIGPVLQFDFGAVADKLLELSSRNSTPSHNRQRLYKIIKVLRNLSEGIFPQDEYPEEVSTDEDDDMFGSRKRMKGYVKGGKKKETSTVKQNKDSGKDAPDTKANDENKKKKKKKKKKAKQGVEGAKENESGQTAAQAQSSEKQTERSSGTEAEVTSSISSVSAATAASPQGQSETVVPSEVKKQPSVTVTADTSCTTDQSETLTKKKKKKKKNASSELKPVSADTEEEKEQSPATAEAPDAPISEKKKKKKKKVESQTENTEPQCQISAEAEVTPAEETATVETDATTPGKKKKNKKKSLKANAEGEHSDITVTSETSHITAELSLKKTKKKGKQTLEAAGESAVTPLKNKRKKNEKEPETAADSTEITTTTPAKKKKKKTAKDAGGDEGQEQVGGSEDAEVDEPEAASSSRKQTKKKKRKIPVVFEFEADEVEAAQTNGLAADETGAKRVKLGNVVEETSAPPSVKKAQKKAKASQAQSSFISFQTKAVTPTPLFCKTKGSPSTPSTPLSNKTKIQTPKSESKKVTFGLKNNKTAEFRKTDRSLLVSPDGSSRVPFDPTQKPKFGVLKSQTPDAKKKSTLKRRPSAADFF